MKTNIGDLAVQKKLLALTKKHLLRIISRELPPQDYPTTIKNLLT